MTEGRGYMGLSNKNLKAEILSLHYCTPEKFTFCHCKEAYFIFVLLSTQGLTDNIAMNVFH